MDDDDLVAQFTSITGAAPDRAAQYLHISDGSLERAIQLFFENGGEDMGVTIEDATTSRSHSIPAHTGAPPVPTASRPNISEAQHRDVIEIESDNEDGGVSAVAATQSANKGSHSIEDDEAMARRLQEEMYGGGGGGGAGDGAAAEHGDGVRAPIGRTAETLMGPNADWGSGPDALNATLAEQLLGRATGASVRSRRPGIFNQRTPGAAPSIWEEGNDADADARRQGLSRATGGESERSTKNNRLAEMYRPPFELMSPLPTWDLIRDEGKQREKWILVNVQDPEVFDSHSLNRDIWRDARIKETVKENFIFKQYQKTDMEASEYIRYYFAMHQSQDAYPHIAIIDPRTGEQVKVWSGTPIPKATDFLMQLHEFLDRYSLKSNSRNPVATRKPEKKKEFDVDKMTEDEMLEMALANSLGNRPGPKQDDPDVLTREGDGAESLSSKKQGKQRLIETDDASMMDVDPPPYPHPQGDGDAAAANTLMDADGHENDVDASDALVSPFGQISSTSPHEEPAATTPNTTRIQFRHPGGRVIRRFGVEEPVRRIYEWLKADPLDGKTRTPFELIFVGKNLIEQLDLSIEAAGLKNGSIMVEFVGD